MSFNLGQSPSPPSYCVEEDKFGRLINTNHNVVYPERPEKGRYSLNNWIRQTVKKHKNNAHTCKCQCGKCACIRKEKQVERSESLSLKNDDNNNTKDLEPPKRLSLEPWSDEESSLMEDSAEPELRRNPIPIPDRMKETFAGALGPEEIKSKLQPTQFLLYYCRTEALKDIDDLSMKLPLTIAYMSNNRQVKHIPLKYDRGSNCWQVEVDNTGAGKNEEPYFHSLTKLVKYYKTFALSNKDGLDYFGADWDES